jgi:hypothetical protein
MRGSGNHELGFDLRLSEEERHSKKEMFPAQAACPDRPTKNCPKIKKRP